MNGLNKKRFMNIRPSNGSTFSFRDGVNVMRFDVADIPAIMDSPNLRLKCNIQITQAGNPIPFNTNVNIDRVLSLNGVIDRLVVKSRRYGGTLEQINHYPRLVSSILSANANSKKLITERYLQGCSVGKSCLNKEQETRDARLPQMSGAATTNTGVNAVRKVGELAAGQDVCLKLHTGLFESALDLDAYGGLTVDIYLNSVESMLWGNGATATLTYTINNPSLIVPVVYKNANQTAQDRDAPQRNLSFLTWTSLYGVLDSTEQNLVYRLFMKGLLSMLTNFIPTGHNSTTTYNSQALHDPGVTRFSVSKDGVRYPNHYTAQVQDEVAGSQYNNGEDVGRVSMKPQLLYNYISVFKNVKDATSSELVPENIVGIAKNDSVFGLGVSFDKISSGLPSVSGTISQNIVSTIQNPRMLATETALNWSGTTPYSAYSFFLNRNNVIVDRQRGIIVV